jgi:hypothetical protein
MMLMSLCGYFRKGPIFHTQILPRFALLLPLKHFDISFLILVLQVLTLPTPVLEASATGASSRKTSSSTDASRRDTHLAMA